MKKLKKKAIKNSDDSLNNLDNSLGSLGNKKLFKDDIKSSRVTIDSRTCNEEKFNQFFDLIDSTKEFKNLISQHCYNHRFSIISDYSSFLKQYKQFSHEHLNAWERQTIYQDIVGHYSETLKRHLAKARYIVMNKNKKLNSPLVKLCQLIDKESTIKVTNQNVVNKYELEFNPELILKSLNEYQSKYQNELKNLSLNSTNNEEEIKLENKIKSYDKLITKYSEIKSYKENKPLIYNRIINLVLTKKVRLINKIKLAEYKTGTHARHLNNAQFSITKDLSNEKYQYFLKVRLNDKLMGREPKLTESNKNNYPELLKSYKDSNFIYLPIMYNQGKLKDINRSLETILSHNNPQILIKSEQLRINKKSRKIHVIFSYEEHSALASKMEETLFVYKNPEMLEPNEENTLGLDVNVKHNLLADSEGKVYDDILKNDNYLNKKSNVYNNGKSAVRSRFMENVNEIVVLNSKPVEERTEKEKYRYEKLLRINKSLLKAYLSVLIKDWKSQGFLHLVMEDLNLANDKAYSKSYYEHAGIKIKYSRLIRLLRLNQIKHWVYEMAEKQGLFTHHVASAYSSQECNNCHHISDKNRINQEEFKCQRCGHSVNADWNSGKNIKERLLNKELRRLLCDDNVYHCARSKGLYYKEVKEIIEKVYKNLKDCNNSLNKESNRVVTELLSV